MALEAPYPDLDELLELIGDAGLRLAEMRASEGAAGNISVYVGWDLEVRRRFPQALALTLPLSVPELAGKQVIVTGSGRRLRDIHRDPMANLAVVAIGPDGQTGRMYTSQGKRFSQVTSEFNSHLAVHADQVRASGTNFHVVIHAQPMHLTYLSHLPAYQDFAYLNHHLLRWQPEIIVQLPQGIGVLPFIMPGSPELMQATLEALRQHRIVLWGKHGVMARSELSVLQAADRIEYAETAAHYEYLDLASGGQGQGLSPQELRSIAQRFGLEQTLF